MLCVGGWRRVVRLGKGCQRWLVVIMVLRRGLLLFFQLCILAFFQFLLGEVEPFEVALYVKNIFSDIVRQGKGVDGIRKFCRQGILYINICD